jgi:hypothetical protein
MLIEPKEFLEESSKLGCTHDEFLICANNVTQQLELIDYYKANGQDIYFVLDYQNYRLTVMTLDTDRMLTSPLQYVELFKMIRYISH